MASTYTWQDAVNLLQNEYPRLVANANAAMIVDQVLSLIWNFADWRFAIVNMEPFFLVPGQQDYGAPNVVIPSDFLGVRRADLTYNVTQPPFQYPPLNIDRTLAPVAWQGRPEALSWEPSVGKFRVFPRVPLGIGPTDYQIAVMYKKLPVRVTASTLGQTMPWDDIYFPTYVEGLRWGFYQNSPNRSQAERLAQWQVFMTLLQKMSANESLNLGDEGLHPQEAWAVW